MNTDFTASRAEPGAAAPRRGAMFAVIALGLLMSSLDSTIVATALHSLRLGLDTSITLVGWTITAYSLGLVVMLPISGHLSDRFGRRRVFLASAALFTAASLCCALVDSIYLLVAFRAIQALGGAGFTPSATGIVFEHFGDQRSKYLGLFGSIFPIGAMLGPVVGGAIVSVASWRWVFLVNGPIGVALIVFGLRLIPADRSTRVDDDTRLDASGVALMGVGLLAVMVALNYLGHASGGEYWIAIVAFTVAAVVLSAFFRHIRRVASPIIHPEMIYGHGFGAVNVVNVVYTGAVLGMLTLVPLYAATRFGMGPLAAGTLLTAQSVAAVLVTTVAAFLLRRTGYRRPIAIGGAVTAGGLALMALGPAGVPDYAWLIVAMAICGIGTGVLSPASRNAGLQLAPERASSLAALRTTGLQIGTIASVSITTAVLAAASNPSHAQAIGYGVLALIVLGVMPVVRRIPEHHGTW